MGLLSIQRRDKQQPTQTKLNSIMESWKHYETVYKIVATVFLSSPMHNECLLGTLLM